jgi:hypothetical protein
MALSLKMPVGMPFASRTTVPPLMSLVTLSIIAAFSAAVLARFM